MAAASATTNRKRTRSEDDDCEDCLPISKRINNLHIRHSRDSWTEGQGQFSASDVTVADVPYNNNNNVFGVAPCCQQGLGPGVYYSDQLGSHQGGCCQAGDGQLAVASMGNPNQLPVLQTQLGLPLNLAASVPNPNFALANGMCGIDNNGVLFDDLNSYEPELKENDNPHYYQANQMLFEAHRSRLIRQHQS